VTGDRPHCRICAGETRLIGTKRGRLDDRMYVYHHCNACHFSFIANPRTDYEQLYSEEYYKGRGADPSVDYFYELEHPATSIRTYEWQGICSIFSTLLPAGGRWLDFGCGSGGMVSYALQRGFDITGSEEGWGAQAGRLKGIPILTAQELNALPGAFDFVTAIEVMEHTVDPLAVLRTIRSVLKPGGILFLTTGNAQPWRQKLLQWGYTACPEVHIGFFEPGTLALAFEKTGFEARPGVFHAGLVDVIRYKVLKELGFKNRHLLMDILPWRLLSAIVDRRHQVSRQPYAIARRHG
jgi:2-polyprenyl-3-methyl-5-hydroxy-6-metoxy-1,4-benzoquinol methylase